MTASGAALALLALDAACRGAWQQMFVWLGLSLIVDGVDGPLARRFEVTRHLARFSGERLDLIVDYLTYVAVPAFALAQSALLPEGTRLAAAIAILLSSLFHFSDTESKTAEGYFVGFPAIWSLAALYLFVLGLAPWLALAIVALLVALTFVPLLYVHPFRTRTGRALNLAATALWAAAAILCQFYPFPSPLPLQILLLVTGGYLLAAGFAASLRKAPCR